MNQVKIGTFLKTLRKENGLTQEQLADKFNVSNRTISRWETGTNMPDIELLIEISNFYAVSITEIIEGKRRSGNMNQEAKETAVAMAKYSKNEVKNGKKKIIGIMMCIFGTFIIMSAMTIFPGESSWGSVYSMFGSAFLIIGIYLLARQLIIKRATRILTVVGCILLLFGFFTFTDYFAVKYSNQVPRFRYESTYDSRYPDQIVHKTIFFTAVQKNPGTSEEKVIILK